MLHLRVPWASRHPRLALLVGMLRHLVVRTSLIHHHAGLRGHRLMGLLGMLLVWRGSRLLWNRRVRLLLCAIVYRLLVWLRWRLSIHASVLLVT